jgi:membrane-associated HD superfamily phosphohydrolase
MLDILLGTPLWVFAVYLLLCYYGIKACSSSRESRKSLLMTPLILIVWSLFSLNHTALSAIYWMSGVALGSLVAMGMFSRKGVSLEADGNGLIIPGTLKILFISQLFFAVKYYIGYQDAVHPELAATTQMLALTGVASGFTVGLFCGRAITLYRALLTLQARAW